MISLGDIVTKHGSPIVKRSSLTHVRSPLRNERVKVPVIHQIRSNPYPVDEEFLEQRAVDHTVLLSFGV